MANTSRKKQKGQGVILGLGLLILTLMISAIAVDVGFYYVGQNTLQTAADASSLAAAKELYASTAVSAATRQTNARNMATQYVGKYTLDQKTLAFDNPMNEVQFGFVDPTTKKYNASSFLTSSNDAAYNATGGYNAVRVTVKKMTGTSNGPLPSIMGRLFGINTMNTQAVSVAMLDDTVNTVSEGLRPVYGCQSQYDQVVQKAQETGTSISDYTVTIFGKTFTEGGQAVSGCPEAPGGNWGFADFRNNEPNGIGNLLTDWFEDGYDGPVVTANSYKSSQSGDELPKLSKILNQLISDQTIILIPLMDSFTGNGTNTQVHITGFTGFVITNYNAKGKTSDFIEGHFVNVVCSQGQGVCQTSSTTSGGGTVNLRLVL
jgi:Flp pilus assembly protein TadG